MRKRMLLIMSAVFFLISSSGCGASTSNLDASAKEYVETAINHVVEKKLNGLDAINALDDELLRGIGLVRSIYYSESIYPKLVSSETDYIGAFLPEDKYGQAIQDFNSAIEWYKYAYENGSLYPGSSYADELDMWVSYFMEHPDSIPVVSNASSPNGLLKYIRKQTGNKDYTPSTSGGIYDLRYTTLELYRPWDGRILYYVITDQQNVLGADKSFAINICDESEYSALFGQNNIQYAKQFKASEFPDLYISPYAEELQDSMSHEESVHIKITEDIAHLRYESDGMFANGMDDIVGMYFLDAPLAEGGEKEYLQSIVEKTTSAERYFVIKINPHFPDTPFKDAYSFTAYLLVCHSGPNPDIIDPIISCRFFESHEDEQEVIQKINEYIIPNAQEIDPNDYQEELEEMIEYSRI